MSVMEGIVGSTISICVTIVFCVMIVSCGQCHRECRISDDDVRKTAIETTDSGTIIFDNRP